MNKPIHPAVAEHVMEENEKLRGLLTQALEFTEANTCGGLDVAQLIAEMRAALSQQAEPTDTYTAVDMATAAAQGFRDGQAAVEPAPAQDEREATLEELVTLIEGAHANDKTFAEAIFDAGFRRPAQTEQQPEQSGLCVAMRESYNEGFSDGVRSAESGNHRFHADQEKGWMESEARAAPIAQTAPQPEQSGLVGMVDAAMIEMRNIAPPLRRSDCERLIRAALSAQGESHE